MKLLIITLTVLQSLFATLDQQTLVSNFSLSVPQTAGGAEQPITYTGHFTMRGDQFAIEILGMEMAYDGQTLYMYNEDMDELTLSTPTQDELLLTNPFLYAQALLPICQYEEKALGEYTQITLTPHDSADGIRQFVLRVKTSEQMPVSAEIHEIEGQVTSLRLTNPQYLNLTPSFAIEKEGAYVNDLR